MIDVTNSGGDRTCEILVSVFVDEWINFTRCYQFSKGERSGVGGLAVWVGL